MTDATPIPQNLKLLHDGEEDLRTKSIALIEADEHLRIHVGMIECCLDLLQYIRTYYDHDDEEQLIVKLIGAEIFNAATAAWKLMLSGYYQSSGLQLRFILETAWLIDYFSIDEKLIQTWKVIDEGKRQQVFRPGMIREKLDKRDGFTEKKRDAHYKYLCVLCGHPTFAGFALLRPVPGADAHMGPFLVPATLTACIQELVKVLMVGCETFHYFFPPVAVADFRANLKYLETKKTWYEHVFQKPSGGKNIADTKAAIAALEPYEDRRPL